MQQDKPTQFRSPIARDSGFTEITGKSAAERGFGPGYTIGFLVTFGLIIASFVAVALAKSELGRARGLGYVLFTFGLSFTFGIGYTIFTSKTIPWTAGWFGRVRTGELDRTNAPLRFWGTCAICLSISLSLMGGGAWVILHAEDVASYLQQHRRR